MAHGTTHGITMLGWSDYVGLIRCRAVPTHQLEARLEHGLGWAVAGQALTPFAELAPNPWGPMAEVRQVPDPSAHVVLPAYDGRAPFDLYLCDSRNPDGTPLGVLHAGLRAPGPRCVGVGFWAAVHRCL